MGAVDLVVQVEAPPTVARGLQRIGRAGHSVGEASRGVIFPNSAATCWSARPWSRACTRARSRPRVPRNPLDVLAQQIVAMAAMDEWRVDDWPRSSGAPTRSASWAARRWRRCSTC